MKARKPAEKGTGDWGLYKGTQYAAAMASTRKFVLAELESPDFYSPCSAIATKVYEVSRLPRLSSYILTDFEFKIQVSNSNFPPLAAFAASIPP